MNDTHFELLVLGAGAAGLTAAREGVRRGARTALVEAAEPGGDCTFTGCVPSKTLLDVDGTTLTTDRLVLATGARPADLRTTAKGVWAIGDVTGRMPFTHSGARMGWIAARNALTASARLLPARFDPSAIPAVTYTSPEVAPVGITEDEAGPKARVAHLPFSLVDRARTSGRA